MRVSASGKFKEAIAYGASKLQYESLTEGQIKTVEGYLSGQDVFVCSPTGSGKSLCFEIAPYAIDWVRFGPLEEENIVRTVCVIVAPLLSLMHDQVASLKRKGIAAICIGPECSQEDLKATQNGHYNLVFGSPEALFADGHRNIFRGEISVERCDRPRCRRKGDPPFYRLLRVARSSQ